MSIKFRWLGFVCFEIVLSSGEVLIVDPFINYSPTAPIKCEQVTGADYILLTHGHGDHCSDVGALVNKFKSKVICSAQVSEPLAKFFNLNAASIIEVTAGTDLVFENFKVEVKKSKHVDLLLALRSSYQYLTGKAADVSMAAADLFGIIYKLKPPSPPHITQFMKNMMAAIPAGEQLNFMLHTPNNLRIYFYSAGGYEFLREQILDAKPNIIFCQLGGSDPESAAEICALSKAEIAIPTHHDGDGLEQMHELAQQMSRALAARVKTNFLDIELGKWYEIGVRACEVN